MGNTVDNNLTKLLAYTGGVEAKTGMDAVAAPERPDESLSCIYAGNKDKESASVTANHFEEYLTAKKEQAKEEHVDEEAQSDQEKEAAKEIRNNVSEDELKQLKLMGIDIEGASLSDLMGILSTMRADAHRKQLAEVFARINSDEDDLMVVGGVVKAAGTDIEIESVDVADVVADDIGESFEIKNDELVYLIKNDLLVSKENLYKAHYSGSREQIKDNSEALIEKLKTQIEEVIEKTGYAGSEIADDAVHFMLANDLPINTETIKRYIQFQEYTGKDISKTNIPSNDTEVYDDTSMKLYDELHSIKPQTVYELAMEGRTVTIAAAISYERKSQYQQKNIPDNNADYGSERELAAVTAMRQLQEIRFAMTSDMAGKLAKLDIDIDTRELSRVVDSIRLIENRMLEGKLRVAGADAGSDNVELVKEVSAAVSSLAAAPAGVIGAPLRGEYFSVRQLLSVSEAEVSASPSGFEAVKKSYEAVWTAPRRDMGDSIAKAFANVDDILTDLGVEVNYDSRRAVRILGYNQMELTPDNIENIMDYDRQVNELIDTFYPEAVLGMIKDGINPLDADINELVKAIRNKNYNEGITEADNFAAYLRDMEKKEKLTDEERAAYIGVYRVMNQLAKSNDREAGWLFANGGRLTIRNLVTAMRSMRASGMELGVGEDIGVKLEGGFVNDIINQIEGAFSEEAQPDTDISEELSAIEEFAQLDERVAGYIVQNNIEYSIVNAFAVDAMMSSQTGLYGLVSEVMSKLRFGTNAKDELIDEETGNMSRSLDGEDIPVPLTTDSILEALAAGEDISYRYEDIRNDITNMMYEAAASGFISAKDIASIKTVNAGLNIAYNMAKQNIYQIPVDTSNGIKVVNLTIKSKEGHRGAIDISVDGGALGAVTLKAMLKNDGSISGSLVSSSSEGNYELMERKQAFDSAMGSQGLSGDIALGTYLNVPDDTYEGNGQDIYRAAVSLVKAVGQII